VTSSTPLTALPALYRAAGLVVVETPGWQTRGRPYDYGPWLGCLHHHTAGPITDRTLTPSLPVVLAGRSDLPGPLCQVYVGRDRKVYMIAAGYANHAGLGYLPACGPDGGNSKLVGFEIENNGIGESWGPLTPTLDVLFAVTTDYLGVPRANVWGHKEYAPGRKTDPAPFDMAAERVRVAAWEEDMALSDGDKKWLTENLLTKGDGGTLRTDIGHARDQIMTGLQDVAENLKTGLGGVVSRIGGWTRR